jgi:putative redox protein
MKTRIKWVQDVSFVAETGSGHAVMMDGAVEAGGRNLAPRPMEMLLVGLGGCAAFDVVMILKRGRAAITDCVVELEAERATTDPKVFTTIKMHFVVSGRKLDSHQVDRAIKLSAEKYCSASAMLGAVAKITHDFEIREADADATHA